MMHSPYTQLTYTGSNLVLGLRTSDGFFSADSIPLDAPLFLAAGSTISYTYNGVSMPLTKILPRSGL